MPRGNGDVDRYVSVLSWPDALKASLNLVPREPRSPPAGVASRGGSNAWHMVLKRPLFRRRTHEDVGTLRERTWRYEQIDDASHRIPLDATDRLNRGSSLSGWAEASSAPGSRHPGVHPGLPTSSRSQAFCTRPLQISDRFWIPTSTSRLIYFSPENPFHKGIRRLAWTNSIECRCLSGWLRKGTSPRLQRNVGLVNLRQQTDLSSGR